LHTTILPDQRLEVKEVKQLGSLFSFLAALKVVKMFEKYLDGIHHKFLKINPSDFQPFFHKFYSPFINGEPQALYMLTI